MSECTSRIKLAGLDELLGINDMQTHVMEIPLEELHDFHNHPFKVIFDEKMDELTESIKEKGILTPGIARKRPEGGYEIISGHRRKAAANMAGLASIPMRIVELSDDEAVIQMVDSNIQRGDILPSERAKALRMRFDAVKHPGKKEGELSLEKIGKETGMHSKSVQRYIQLSNLSNDLLEKVDNKRIGFSQGIMLSALNNDEQKMLNDILEQTDEKMTGIKAREIRELSRKGCLDRVSINYAMRNEPVVAEHLLINLDEVTDLFPVYYSKTQIEELIVRLVKEWAESFSGEKEAAEQ